MKPFTVQWRTSHTTHRAPRPFTSRRGQHMRSKGALAVAAAAALTLAACGGPEEEADADGELEWDSEAGQYVMEEEIASGEVPLKIWMEEDYLAEAVIAAFNEEYPDVEVEVELVPKNDAVQNMS